MKPLLRNIFLSRYALLVWAFVLIIISIIFNKVYTNWSSVTQELRHAERYISQTQKDFRRVLSDTDLISRLVKRIESPGEFHSMVHKPYGLFIYGTNSYGQPEIRFWSDQQALPSPETLTKPDGEYFEHLPNGYYLTVKKTLQIEKVSGSVQIYAMIPIRSDYFIETDYLPKRFYFSHSAEKRVIISSSSNYPVRSLSGNTVFYLDKKAAGAVPYNDAFTIWLRLGAVLLLLFFVHLVAEGVARKKGPWVAIGTLTGILLLLRLGVYLFPPLLNLRQFGLFNPTIYGSNSIQRSLGDLLINSVLFCWIIVFAWARLRNSKFQMASSTLAFRKIVAVLSLLFLIFSTFLLSSVIRSLVADSKISFDVTDFFSLNQYTVAGFVILAALSLSYYYFSQLLFRLIFPQFEGRIFQIYFIMAFVGLVYLTTRSGDEVLFYLPVLLWLLIYSWLVNRQGVIFRSLRINIAGILFWIFIFSVSIAAIMLSENTKVEWEKRKRMADKLAEQTDPSSETLMRIAIEFLDNDFLSANFYRFRNPIQNIVLRDSILKGDYAPYLNKYDTRLYVYDSLNLPVNNDDPSTYETWNTIRNVQSKETRTEGLYYYETSFDKFHYLTWREVTDSSGQKLGTFIIVSNPKKYSGDALFPELFKQFKETDPENSPIYSNAIYDNWSLVSPPGKYPFPISLTEHEVPKQEYERRRNGDFDELWYRAGKKIVVIARKRDTLIETITLFSYIFCAFLFLVALAQLISFIIRKGYNWKGFRSIFQMNIRTQVHSTIIFISIFSFVIIGFATISFFISRYNRNNSDKLSRTMKIMVNEMQKKISDHNTFDDVVKIYDSVANYDLQKLVNEVSDIHGVDVNVYDLNGDLYVSSEANVYTKGVLSKKMDPTAFYHLSRLRQVQHAQKEKIGNLTYLSIYAPVRDEEGKVYEYINIPYFTSGPELNQEISNFLVTIINLNAFIFLVAGLIALFITNRITNSFSIISEKMKEVSLGSTNEEISWSRDDEIGELVKEYNKMVAKLGESAAALAKSEREGAWREMARQVAHEIKNPLTPMKLSLQFLQKAIDNNQGNVKELTASVANTLVEQIDHLSKIAADFSQFANIGNINVELFDLHEVLGSVKELYSPNQQIDMDWKPVQGRLMIKADKTQMNRLFTNLMANAVEACHVKSVCRVELIEQRFDGVVRISVKDNGEGISKDIQPHIFVPNFTTKSSGTGLGLAMSKGIVEQAKGKIWFETEQGRGTTFHVELPLAGSN